MCLALIFLVAASFVASSEEGQQECDNITITFGQDPTGKVTSGTLINFTWNITKEPPSCLAGEPYFLEIKDKNNLPRHYNDKFKIPLEPCSDFTGNDSWKVPDDEPIGSHISYLTIPGFGGSHIEFEVEETLLVIQKVIDNKDKSLKGWEFKVTVDKKAHTYETDEEGKIQIPILEENAGKYYIIEEIPKDNWKPVPKKTVKVTKGETTTVQFLNEISDTILIIRKFDDTNRNGRIDGGDERLQGWEFKVTYPDGNAKTYYTNSGGETVIKVPPEYAGKDITVEEILQPGWKSILPSKQTVNVPAGETKTVQFLNSPPLLIIQKFNDSNRNNRIDDSDERLQGWEFKVTDPGRRTTTHFTNPRGEIRIEVPGEHAGKDYIIEETVPLGWKQIQPIERLVPVKVPLGEAEHVQFLNTRQNTTLIIQKFNDTNRNDEVDDGVDIRLPGWNFNITDPAGKSSTHITNDAGEIIIEVPEEHAGKEYTIEETLLPDWELVLPIEQPVHVKVPMGETKPVQFLNKKIGTLLIIRKFNDSNQNKEVDSEDERLPGWNFSVTNPAGKTTPHNTNDKGEIIIDVPPEYIGKEYTIVETPRSGWRAVNGSKKTVKASKGKTTPVEFLNGIIVTRIVIQKVGSDKRQGLEFKVTDPAGKTTPYITDNNGKIIIVVPPKYAGKEYTIEEIPLGDRKLIEIDTSAPIIEKGEQRINIKAETDKESVVNFINSVVGDLTIHKFNDSNQNKVQDLEEQGLAWNFIVTFPDGSTKRIPTDANGIYTLHDIPVGRYEITEEPGSCLWASSTETTQRVDVEAGKEKKAFFGNYIAECCILPGCIWNNRDKNIEVCKSVNPCNVTLGKEAEVTVHLGLCVDPEHILNGTKVRNISVIDTLHNQFTIVEGSFSEDPNASWSNPDGTTTLEWNISSLCCEEWHVSFNVTVAFALPIDVTESYGVSKVMYDDPNIEETKVVKELPIPAGKLLFVLPTPTPTPTTTSTPTPTPPGFEALLAIAGLLAVGYMMWRRKR